MLTFGHDLFMQCYVCNDRVHVLVSDVGKAKAGGSVTATRTDVNVRSYT